MMLTVIWSPQTGSVDHHTKDNDGFGIFLLVGRICHMGYLHFHLNINVNGVCSCDMKVTSITNDQRITRFERKSWKLTWDQSIHR
jgi:hypothetical protein